MTPHQPDVEVSAETAARLQAIYERARASFAGYLTAIDAAVSGLKTGALDESSRRAARHAAHRLAGAAGTVGYPDATAPAQRLEAAFTEDLHPDQTNLLEADAAALRTMLSGNEVPATPFLELRTAVRVLALHAADDLDAQIRSTASANGLGVTTDPSGAGIEAAIVDLAGQDGESLIRGYAERQPSVPVVALADTASLADRLAAATAGASLVLPRSGSPTEVIDAAQSLSKQSRQGPYRILAVDDDPVMLAALSAVLLTEPLEVTTLEDPRNFWTVLEQTAPDLVVLDVDMPHLDGIALCRIIRTDPRWSTLPVLFLTSHTDPDAIDAVFAAGADDFVSKPLVASEVRARIRNRLDRVALYRKLADTDPLTGLANRRRLEGDFDRLSSLARRHHQPLSIALLDIDHFKRVNDTHGHDIGDLVLRRLADRLTKEFRGADVVARWGGEEMAILSFAMSGADAAHRLTDVLEAIRGTPFFFPERPQSSLRVSFSAGVADLGLHGDDLRTLARAADSALYRAKQSGRARVLRAEDKTRARSAAPSPSD